MGIGENVFESSSALTMRILLGEREEMEELQVVFESSPIFAERMTGVPFGPAEALSVYTVLPENVSYDRKFVFGFFLGKRMVGCADIIIDYPEVGICNVGLLLLAEPFQGNGFGRSAYSLLEAYAKSSHSCKSARVSVARCALSKGFWIKLGFSEMGHTKPYIYSKIASVSDILSRSFDDLY